jgi:hypothetical protein
MMATSGLEENESIARNKETQPSLDQANHVGDSAAGTSKFRLEIPKGETGQREKRLCSIVFLFFLLSHLEIPCEPTT